MTAAQRDNGSPPREWGQRHLGPPTQLVCGRGTVHHPHASGDSESPCLWLRTRGGSPPREWGQPEAGIALQVCQRFTPTRVGTAANHAHRLPNSTRFTPTRVGTACHGDEAPRKPPGSPPREWGQLYDAPTRVHPHASGDSSATVYGNRVHPHASGDSPDTIIQHPHASGDSTSAERAGSPPREWGQPPGVPPKGWGQPPEALIGFTPTRVGTALEWQ